MLENAKTWQKVVAGLAVGLATLVGVLATGVLNEGESTCFSGDQSMAIIRALDDEFSLSESMELYAEGEDRCFEDGSALLDLSPNPFAAIYAGRAGRPIHVKYDPDTGEATVEVIS